MKCPRCHGTGKITEWVVTDTLSEYEFPCRKCNGTGEIALTNEEWFCSLSTEEKARFITRYGIRRQVLHSFETVGESIQKSTDKHLGTNDIYEPIEEWLKQPHKEKHDG